MLDLSSFRPGENLFLQYGLREGLGFTQLWPAAVLLAMVLAYCAYTDVFCGRIIRNSTTLSILIAGLATAPLLHTDLRAHFGAAIIMIVIICLLYIVGVFVEGDLKLYAALAFVFAEGVFMLMLLSWVIIACYGIGPALRNRRRRRSDVASGVEKPRREYLTKMPAGPGIALAYPATLYLTGVPLLWCAGLVLLQVLLFALAPLLADFGRRADALEAEEREAREASEEQAEPSSATERDEPRPVAITPGSSLRISVAGFAPAGTSSTGSKKIAYVLLWVGVVLGVVRAYSKQNASRSR